MPTRGSAPPLRMFRDGALRFVAGAYPPGMDPTLTAAAIGVGGTVIVGVAGLWANVRNTSKTTALALQGQVTDRYSKAIEQLGSEKLDVRIGGIYALERVARDSPRDHPTIMEVLAAFIREHSREQWPPAKDGAEPPKRTTRPDVQAAATVIGRRTVRYDNPSQRVNLTGANLRYADLTGADLAGVDLTGAFFHHAILIRANLARATLRNAVLVRANLTDAKLTRAYLGGGSIAGANPRRGPHRRGPHRRGPRRSDFTGARGIGFILPRVLPSVNLTDALWPPHGWLPKGWQRDTGSGRLKRRG